MNFQLFFQIFIEVHFKHYIFMLNKLLIPKSLTKPQKYLSGHSRKFQGFLSIHSQLQQFPSKFLAKRSFTAFKMFSPKYLTSKHYNPFRKCNSIIFSMPRYIFFWCCQVIASVPQQFPLSCKRTDKIFFNGLFYFFFRIE